VGELFRFHRGPKATLPDEVFLFALLDFWESFYPERRSFSVEFLTFERGSPGQVFLLDETAVSDRLARLEELSSGRVRWDESSGMRQLYMHDSKEFDRWDVLREMFHRDMKGGGA
jgi:hypothetical protein